MEALAKGSLFSFINLDSILGLRSRIPFCVVNKTLNLPSYLYSDVMADYNGIKLQVSNQALCGRGKEEVRGVKRVHKNGHRQCSCMASRNHRSLLWLSEYNFRYHPVSFVSLSGLSILKTGLELLRNKNNLAGQQQY